MTRLLPLATAAAALWFCATVQAAAPGITSTGGTVNTFNLVATDGYINQPDGQQVYVWGYGCTAGSAVTTGVAAPATGTTFKPTMTNQNCSTMQIPAPTLIVTEGTTVTVTLTNNLPKGAGNTSILFPGFNVTAGGGVAGLLAQEATPGTTVTYTFTASSPGTRAYYSGTQGDLQIEMGLYGAIIVLPATVPTNCNGPLETQNAAAKTHWGETDFRLAHAAYDHPKTCYDREYLFQWSEMDANIHKAAKAQVDAIRNSTDGCAVSANGGTGVACTLQVPTEPYHPAYFLINGRSMPDLMDPNYDSPYPHQPYNGNPHMHPGEQVLLRVIGQGRWQHPFHEHANHVRILARDGNLILTPDGQALAGILMFNTDTTPGQAFDGIFYFSGRGLNWDMFGHNPTSKDPLATLPCTPDAFGYNTGFLATDTTYSGTPNPAVASAVNYYEWCADHNKPVEANPFGDVPAGGPATLPNPNIFTNGAWYGGSPYFGPDATLRAVSTLRNDNNPAGQGCATGQTVLTTPNEPGCTNLQPSNTQANPANERGWAFMWHSHNEREITTNNVFPGGMLMMMLVDSREFVIDEQQ
jgi:FtsP/CotA-like multicopper oxidase with cupredoxin domain